MTNPKKVRPARASATKLGVPAAEPQAEGSAAADKPLAAKAVEAPPQATTAKPRLVRDSFTIPKSEYAVLEALKLRAANLTRPTKKSELLRAGIGALHAMTDEAFLAALNTVPSLKTGRPKAALPAAKLPPK
jgi:hypothetical protein